MNDKTHTNPKGAGRKAGVRSEKYNNALQDYLSGGGSVAEIAKKYDISRQAFYKAINATNQEAEATLGTNDLRSVAVESKNAVIEGLKNIEVLKKSDNPTHNALAENIITSIQETNLTLAKNIQIIGGGLLKDLHKEIGELRARGEMKMGNINKALTNLEIANRIMGVPKSPSTQINIQNNNANIQGGEAKKDDDVLELVLVNSKEEAQKIIEGEIID